MGLDISKIFKALEKQPVFQRELIRQIHRFENYDPQKDYYALFAKAKTVWEQQAVIRKYYQDNEIHILSLAKENLKKSFDINAFEWQRIFSPIEKDAWYYIKCSGIILYPQYPVLNYMVDFGNPYLKIALELDGKEFHDKEKDKKRDQRIYDETGWKVFRVPGSEAVKDTEMPNRCPDKFDDEGLYRIREFMTTTVDGVVEAIKEIYFTNNRKIYYRDERRFYELCLDTLEAHRLAKFPIP